MLYGAMFSCLDPVHDHRARRGSAAVPLPHGPPGRARTTRSVASRPAPARSSARRRATLVAAYAGWIRAKARGRAYERDFLSKAFLSAQTLRQISDRRQQYVELLDQIGFLRSGAGLFPEEQWRTCRYNRCDSKRARRQTTSRARIVRGGGAVRAAADDRRAVARPPAEPEGRKRRPSRVTETVVWRSDAPRSRRRASTPRTSRSCAR